VTARKRVVLGLLLALAECSPAGATPRDTVDMALARTDWANRPGLVVGVHHRGERVYLAARGRADLEQGTVLTPLSVFNIASVSKHLTAFAALLLEREGRLRLDEDVRTYLPWLPDFGHKITVRHLILHTSGLREEGNLFIMAGRTEEDYRRHAQVLSLTAAQTALNFPPGTDHLYTNTNYVLLAQIVANVSGRSFREFARERIFVPLGMTRTFFRDDVREVVPGKANSYAQGSGAQHWRGQVDNDDLLGSSNLFTTAEDMLRWAANFSQPRVGDAALIERFLQMGSLDDGTPLDYGYGLMPARYAGRDAVVHGGKTAEFEADFTYLPREDFAVVTLRNSAGDTQQLVEEIVKAYLGDVGGEPLVPPRAQLGAGELDALEGDYLAPYNSMISLRRSGNALLYTASGSPPQAHSLVPRRDGTLDLGDELRAWKIFFTPQPAEGGEVKSFIASLGGGRRSVQYERVTRVGPPTDHELRELAGSYRSAELDVTYRLTVEQGRLVVRSLWLAEGIVLRPMLQDQFDSESWWLRTLEFVRDAKGIPTGFLIHAGRVRNVAFERTGDR
jgi:CubicO group peptidase (beta-lactamase class C family)